MSKLAERAADEWRLGGTLVLASTIGFSFHSVMASATGLFMQPLGEEFGWSRAQTSMGISIAAVISALLSPFAGAMIDRWGSRRIALPGLIVMSLSVASFSLTNGVIAQWVALWLIYGVVSLSVKSTVWATAVSGSFSAARGFALGVTMCGAAVAQIITPPVTNALIEHFGWRVAYAAVGLGWGGIAFVFSALFLYDARDRRERARAASPERAAEAPPLEGLSLQQAWRDPSLWKLAISTLIIMTVTIAIMAHQFPLLTEAGVSRQNAALLASLGGVAGIAGKLVTGWLMDHAHARWVGGVTLAATSLTFLLLLEPFRTPALIVAAMLINGYASGSKLQICTYLTARYAGLRNFGTIFGFMASVIAFGSGLGPVFGGLVYDAYGDYTPFLIIGVFGSLISGGLILSLGAYPKWDKPGEAETPAPAPA